MERSTIPVLTDKKDYCEVSSSKPVSGFIPNQSLKISELIERFESGRRLNVHENFKPLSNFTDGRIEIEDFSDAAPEGIHDIVDVHEYYNAHKEHVADYKKRKAKAKQASQVQTQQAQPAPAPSDSE